jgi:hypothetical protein
MGPKTSKKGKHDKVSEEKPHTPEIAEPEPDKSDHEFLSGLKSIETIEIVNS